MCIAGSRKIPWPLIESSWDGLPTCNDLQSVVNPKGWEQLPCRFAGKLFSVPRSDLATDFDRRLGLQGLQFVGDGSTPFTNSFDAVHTDIGRSKG